ncbi:MAG: HAD family hydrolase [Flavobacteriales bacterium]|nr:HAD family hydrolase [Flavobacteriales bacterium]
MNKAVFLDRDGVINMERDTYTYLREDFVLVDGMLDQLKRLQEAGYLLVVISNQSGISKGLYRHEEVLELHEVFLKQCADAGVNVAGFYYCPHHPDYGRCLCRKPDSLMLEKALARFNIDAGRSFMIGDKPRDIEAAEKAGVKGLLVDANAPIQPLVNQILQMS